MTREAYGYVYGNPLNATDPLGLAGRRKATKREVAQLAKLLGEPVEKIKTINGRHAGALDIYVEEDGEMVIAPDADAEGEPVEVNTSELKTIVVLDSEIGVEPLQTPDCFGLFKDLFGGMARALQGATAPNASASDRSRAAAVAAAYGTAAVLVGATLLFAAA